jgi:hypothetical protein
MTTSWAHCVRGNLRDALGANVGGTLLCLLSLASLPMMLGLAVRGRPTSGWFLWSAACVFFTAVSIAVLEWGIRLAAG